MKRPTKKEIKAAVDKLREAAPNSQPAPDHQEGKLAAKKSSQRIRKQGV
jgi:hypothetical protein